MITALETAVVIALVFFINSEPEPKPLPKTPDEIEGRKPQVWDDQENRDWLFAMPFKADMRHMWIDSNRIVSAGRGDRKTDFSAIYTASSDIAQRSGNYAKLWEDAAQRYQNLMECEEDLRAGDWISFDVDVQIAWNACNTCHLSAWSPHYLHVTEGSITAWTSDKLTPLEGNIETDSPPPEIQNRRTMHSLIDAFSLIDKCNLKKDPKYVDQMVEGCKTIIRIATQRGKFWRAINESAMLMKLNSDPDETKDVDKVQSAYVQMVAQCRTCHATQASGERKIMTPLSWEK